MNKLKKKNIVGIAEEYKMKVKYNRNYLKRFSLFNKYDSRTGVAELGWQNWGWHWSLGIFSGLATLYFSSLYNLSLSAYVFFKINSGNLVLCSASTPLGPKWVWAKLNNTVHIINPYPFLTPMYNDNLGPTWPQ